MVYFSVNKGSDDIIAKIYLTTEYEKDKWTWKPCDKSNGFRNCLKDKLEKTKLPGFVKTRKSKTQQCFAKKEYAIKVAADNNEEAVQEIVDVANSFVEYIKEL